MKFTKELIADWKYKLDNPVKIDHTSHTTMAQLSLEEIEHLQARMQELENGLKIKQTVIDAGKKVIAELEAKNEMIFDQLQDPISVRINILSGRIRIPDDLVWFYDNFGKVAELKNRIEELEAERRWVPVNERLPGNIGFYYCHLENKAGEAYERIAYYYGNGVFDAIEDTVTHWQPLPQPPEAT